MPPRNHEHSVLPHLCSLLKDVPTSPALVLPGCGQPALLPWEGVETVLARLPGRGDTLWVASKDAFACIVAHDHLISCSSACWQEVNLRLKSVELRWVWEMEKEWKKSTDTDCSE